ncbi:hypothetical protein M5D96_004650 [Drosophila gunungcola]|uniref:Uncharacterized protein n=1 Tax=Drosophila gunungcola TaxID=103775 RepID=A0A9P9YUH9_9MUSC|nr:hypothetical protein M5D96_004650 [Drosophila gunungcola]
MIRGSELAKTELSQLLSPWHNESRRGQEPIIFCEVMCALLAHHLSELLDTSPRPHPCRISSEPRWGMYVDVDMPQPEGDGDDDDDDDDALGHCTLANGTCGHTLVRKKLSISKQTSHSRSSSGYAFVPISRLHLQCH